MITASLTTLPNRTEALKETVESLLPQVDKLNIFLHGYMPADLPGFLKDEKIELAYDIEWGDHGDIDKFHWAFDVEGYHLICDDDLIYPSDYAETMVGYINKFDRNVLITCHGSIIHKLPIANYYTDRFAYPCLGEVKEETKVHIGGTGVMGFHSDIKWDLDFTNKSPNMADIHVGVWAGEKKKEIITIPHSADWIRHTDKIEQKDTISGKAMISNNGVLFQPVAIINSRPDLFYFQMQPDDKPLVSVIVINSRMKSHPTYVKECYDSLRIQTYENIEIIVIENYDKIMTIGKGFNEGVKKAKGKYCLFVGDDDFISEDYVASLVGVIEGIPDDGVTVGISSFLIMFSSHDNGVRQEPRELVPTGMWKREFLVENPFREYLTKYVDTEMFDRANDMGKHMITMRHHYGYFYRSHPGQSSGFKALAGDHGVTSNNRVEMKERIKELESNES